RSTAFAAVRSFSPIAVEQSLPIHAGENDLTAANAVERDPSWKPEARRHVHELMEHSKSERRDPRAGGDGVFLQLFRRITKIPSADVHIGFAIIVEFDGAAFGPRRLCEDLVDAGIWNRQVIAPARGRSSGREINNIVCITIWQAALRNIEALRRKLDPQDLCRPIGREKHDLIAQRAAQLEVHVISLDCGGSVIGKKPNETSWCD